MISIARGDLDGAERILEIFDGYSRSSDVQEVAAYACAGASVLRARSRDGEALEAARRAIAGALQLGYTGTAKVGCTQGIGAAFSLGDLDAVRGFIATIDELKPGSVTPFLRALADRSRARIAALDGDGDGAERNFKAAIGLFRETEVPYWRALSQLEYAEWLVDQGRREEAPPAVTEARDTLDRLGAVSWSERLDRLEMDAATAST